MLIVVNNTNCNVFWRGTGSICSSPIAMCFDAVPVRFVSFLLVVFLLVGAVWMHARSPIHTCMPDVCIHAVHMSAVLYRGMQVWYSCMQVRRYETMLAYMHIQYNISSALDLADLDYVDTTRSHVNYTIESHWSTVRVLDVPYESTALTIATLSDAFPLSVWNLTQFIQSGSVNRTTHTKRDVPFLGCFNSSVAVEFTDQHYRNIERLCDRRSGRLKCRDLVCGRAASVGEIPWQTRALPQFSVAVALVGFTILRRIVRSLVLGRSHVSDVWPTHICRRDWLTCNRESSVCWGPSVLVWMQQ